MSRVIFKYIDAMAINVGKVNFSRAAFTLYPASVPSSPTMGIPYTIFFQHAFAAIDTEHSGG
jgi:hypothetical protein